MIPVEVSVYYPSNDRSYPTPSGWPEYSLTDNFIVGEIQRRFYRTGVEATERQFAFGPVVTGVSRESSSISMRCTFFEDDPAVRRAKLRELAAALSWVEVAGEPLQLSITDDFYSSQQVPTPVPTYYKAYPTGSTIDWYIGCDSFVLEFELPDPTLWSFQPAVAQIGAGDGPSGIGVLGNAAVPVGLTVQANGPAGTHATLLFALAGESLPGGGTLHRLDALFDEDGSWRIEADSINRVYKVNGEEQTMPIYLDWIALDPKRPMTFELRVAFPTDGSVTAYAQARVYDRWVV